MSGYIGNKAVGLNVTTGDILGDVGIGGDLDVNGAATFSQTRTETNTEADIGAYINFRNLSTAVNTGVGLTLGSNNDGGTAIIGQRVGSNNEHILKLQVRNSAGSSGTRMSIDGAGNVNLASGNLVIGTSGKGIDFSATADGGNSASVASELLDHYEEGSWTPTAAGGGITVASVVKAGYNRTGNVVNIQMYITISAQGNTSALQIGGLPFGIPSQCYNVGAVDFEKSAHAAIYPRTESGSTNMSFYFSPANVSAGRTVALGNDIGAGYIILSMTYML